MSWSSLSSSVNAPPRHSTLGNARFLTATHTAPQQWTEAAASAPSPVPYVEQNGLLVRDHPTVNGPATEVNTAEPVAASMTAAAAAPVAHTSSLSPQHASAQSQVARRRRVYSSSSSTYSSSYTYATSATYAEDVDVDVRSSDSAPAAPTAAPISPPNTAARQPARAAPADQHAAPAVERTALSADAFQQVQQQLHHPRVPRRDAARGVELPGWWSRESSVLPANTPTTTSSATECSEGLASGLADRVLARARAEQRLSHAAEMHHRLRRAKEEEEEEETSAVESTTTSSSCGCPSDCTCRSAANTRDGAAAVVATQHRHRSPQRSRVPRPRGTSCRIDVIDATQFRAMQREREAAYSLSRHKHAAGATHGSDSDTICSSPDRNHNSSSDTSLESCLCSVCSRCIQPPIAASVESTSDALCSSCEAAARTRVVHLPQRTPKAPQHREHTSSRPFHQTDVFADAVRYGSMLAEIPPLLHLSAPAVNTAKVNDATVLAERDKARLRAEYMRQAALLAAGKHSAVAEPTDAASAVNSSGAAQRCAAGTQTETPAATAAALQQRREEEEREAKAREAAEVERRQREERRAEERLRALAAAQCAEVALPMLQRELESYQTHRAQQQQQQVEALLQQLEACQRQMERQQAMHAAELVAAKARWEREQQAARAQERARQLAGRRQQGTDLVEADLVPVVDPATLHHAVGTQHSDGTLERLAAVEAVALEWMRRHLTELEEATRRTVEEDEAAARHHLKTVVEEPTRRAVTRCEATVLHWRQRCEEVRASTAHSAEVRALVLQEKCSRQEIAEACWTTLTDLRCDWLTTTQASAASAAAQESARVAAALAATQHELEALQGEHKDTVEHARQLRLQLVHALRMPTVTLTEGRSSALPQPVAPGAPLMAAAYAYATAGAAGGGSAVQGDASSSSAHARGAADSATAQQGWSAMAVVDEDLPVHRRFARAHQEALRVVRAQCRSV